MAKTCIKCGYTRRETDTAADYACPACGVVYAKAEAAQARLVVARARAPTLVQAPAPAPASPAAASPSAQADLLIQQLALARGSAARAPSRLRGMALVALAMFAIGFASAAGMYSGALRLGKAALAAAEARCAK